MECKVNCFWCWRLTIILTGVLVIVWLQPIEAARRGGEVMELKSTAFVQSGKIPARYTCDGQDISPPLEWGAAPKGTESLAIICDDPDAPVGIWVHWVYYDIPVGETRLPEHVRVAEQPATGGRQGINDFRKVGYGGPCPPGGTHRYYFKIFALDVRLNLPVGTTKPQLLKAMSGHILDQAELMGVYRR
ncbi:MAG: YbhB/YbcL family Raf kinase inhibitor-like protein [Pseudomonadota bacterium]|nr:YbhB/YbcL family Raf kinase inhibitor-like protein [Pseudomonadota bacterium]